MTSRRRRFHPDAVLAAVCWAAAILTALPADAQQAGPAWPREIVGKVTEENFGRFLAIIAPFVSEVREFDLTIDDRDGGELRFSVLLENTDVTVTQPAGPEGLVTRLRIAPREIAKARGTYRMHGRYLIERDTPVDWRLRRVGPPSGRDYTRARMVLP